MEAKRRLPLWMAGGSKVDKVSRPLDADANDVITKEEASVVTECTNPKPKGRTRNHKKEVCLPSDGKNFIVKCDTKRKKRGFVEKDVIVHHNPEQETIVEKRKHGRVGRKGEEPNPSRKKEEFESSDENEAPSCDEVDEDLTMDDLLSIAKEFVVNDMGEQKASEGECKLKSKSSYTPPSVTTIQDTTSVSPMHEETACHHDSNENRSKVTLNDSRMTGDPAQDMLDLFLGPLLKKPIGEVEPSSIKDVILHPNEVKNQQQDSVISSNKPVTLTKKKSSLRDAVAMLLDR